MAFRFRGREAEKRRAPEVESPLDLRRITLQRRTHHWETRTAALPPRGRGTSARAAVDPDGGICGQAADRCAEVTYHLPEQDGTRRPARRQEATQVLQPSPQQAPPDRRRSCRRPCTDREVSAADGAGGRQARVSSAPHPPCRRSESGSRLPACGVRRRTAGTATGGARPDRGAARDRACHIPSSRFHRIATSRTADCTRVRSSRQSWNRCDRERSPASTGPRTPIIALHPQFASNTSTTTQASAVAAPAAWTD